MQLKYKILVVDPHEHQIIVRYYSDVTIEQDLALEVDSSGVILRCRTDYAITLPVPIPAGIELDQLIARACPRNFFTMKADIANPKVDTSMSILTKLIGQENIVPDITPVDFIPQIISPVTIV